MSSIFAGTQFERPVTCERCEKPLGECACPRDWKSGKVLEPRDQQVRVRREKRNGKYVTVVSGLTRRSERTNELPGLMKELKKTLGVGGTMDEAKGEVVLELQGDHRERLVKFFQGLGYPAKAAGG